MECYDDFMRDISSNIKKMRLMHGKTVEDVAIDGLGHNSAAFFSQAENYKNGKHFNLRHIYLLAVYFQCRVSDLIP